MPKKHYRSTTRKRKKRKPGKNEKRRKVIVIVLTAILFLACMPFAYHFFIRSTGRLFQSFDSNVFTEKYVVRGIDVSHHNSFINWHKLREENITFVYIKSTEGDSHKDREYQENYRLAKISGFKVGTYHFYTFGMDGASQAEHFIRNANVASGDIIPAIDVEHSTINRFLKDAESVKKIIGELKILEQSLFEYYGIRPIIYTNKECYKRYIKGNFTTNPIWICDLRAEPDNSIQNWVIWQFSHTGQINGISDNVDLNYYRYSFTEFRNLLMP